MIPAQIHLLNLIGQRLKNISLINGYHYDIEKIKREKIGNFTGKEIPIIFYWSETDTTSGNSTRKETRKLPVFIAGFFKTRDNTLVDGALEFGSDIYTSLFRNPNSPNFRDAVEIDLGCEFVENLTIEDISPIVGQGESPYAGVMVSATIDYSIEPGIITFEAC